MTKLAVDDTVPVTTFTTFKGETVSLANSRTPLIHIQFRRHAGCPICDLHLRSVMKHEDELTKLGVSEIVFFHSTPEELKRHTSYLPFPCIADPTKIIYKKFGTEESKGVADSFTWRVASALSWAVGSAIVDLVKGERQLAPLHPTGGRDQFPADLLVNKAGKVLAAKYGMDIADQWSVKELFELANNFNSECKTE
jgi:peroxiredoxin